MEEELDIEECEKMCGLTELHKSAGWWIAREDIALIAERPVEIHRDGEGRLHSESGMSISWPDGWGVYSVHGVRVPERVVMSPETLTPDEILTERNTEVRRVMMDRFGYERLLRESDAKLLDESEWGKLWRLEIKEDEPVVMVECVNSTPEPDGSFKDYFLRVPENIQTARAALAWTFDVPEENYTLAKET